MAGNRAKATSQFLKEFAMIDKTGENLAYWKEKLTGMTDAQFDTFVDEIEKENIYFSISIPNFNGKSFSVAELLVIGEKLGHKFFESVWLTDKITGICYLSVEKYLILDMPVRRQSQTWLNKISLASDSDSVDTLSGQVTGDSKSSRLSFVELQILNFTGCDRTIEELAKPRGGDLVAGANLEKQILDTGEGSLDAPGMDTGSVKSVDVQAAIFRACHLENTLDK